MMGQIGEVPDYRSDLAKRFRPAMEMCRTLVALKTNNEEYRMVLERLTIDEFTNLPGNGSFGDGYSSEYELGYRRGLSIFLFPEAELERLEERKRALLAGE
jgi:hypothetical protein